MNKKIFFAIIVAVISLVSFSCSKIDRGGASDEGRLEEDTTKILNVFTTPAGPEDDTKMTYSEETGDKGFRIAKTWEVGDELIGFVTEIVDEKSVYKYFTYRCTKIENNEATWTRVADADSSCANTPSKTFDGALHMAFAPGVGAKGFRDDGEITLSGSILNQKDGEQMTIACGTGKIIDQGKMQIKFANQMALFSFRDITLNDIGSSTTVSEIEIDGVYTSATLGTIKTSEGKDSLVAVPAGNLGVVTYKPREGTTWTVSDKSGKKMLFPTTDGGKPLFLAVLPGSALNKMSIKVITADGPDYRYSIINSSANIQTKPYRIQGKTLDPVKVAEIGSTNKYTTIAAAMEAANGAGSATTVTLLDNCKIKTDLPAITNTYGVTLDLNGKTIITSGIKDVSQKRISVNNGGILTITDSSSGNVESQGSIVAADGTKGVSPVLADGGTLTINGGNIISNPANSDDIDAAVYVKGGATATISGGFIKGMGSEGALSVSTAVDLLQQNKKCSLFITGGSFEADSNTVQIYRSDANITGGTICATNTSSAKEAPKYAVKVSDKSNTTKVKGFVEIGGTVDIRCDARQGICILGNDSDTDTSAIVKISGGTIAARIPVFVDDKGRCDITGGEIRCGRNGWYMLTATGKSTINITGGKIYCHPDSYLATATSGNKVLFSGSVISNKPFLSHRVLEDYVLDRYTGTDDECLFCLAQEENSITATVDGGTYYCTPAGAEQFVNHSSMPVTLTVQNDFSTSKLEFYAGRENLITLDLNGKTISSATTNQNYLIVTSSSLTITDSSNTSNGALSGGHCAVYADSTAKLTINGGSFSGDGLKDVGNGVIYATSTADSLIIKGGTITCNASSADCRAVNIGCKGEMTGGKISSKGSCLRLLGNGTANFTVTGQNDDIEIISDTDAYANMLIVNTGTLLTIEAGHYYISGPSSGTDSVKFQSDNNLVVVKGGKMNFGSSKITPASGYVVAELNPGETFKEKNYKNKVQQGSPVVNVNGTDFNSLSDAYNAAMAIEDTVTIKLLANVTLPERWDFNKKGDRGTRLNLNGKIITSAIDSVFTPKTTLTITDTTTTPGTITSAKTCIIALNNEAYATVYINNCTIKTTNDDNIDRGDAVLRTSGTSSNASKRIFNIGENAKISGYNVALFACRGIFNISSNAEITARRIKASSALGALYVFTGGKVTISDNASLKGYNAMASGSGNSATKVEINGGYFYAHGNSGTILKLDTSSSTSEYDKQFNFQGGYYNKEVNKTSYPKATIKNDAATSITAVKHSHGGTSLSYGYQIQ